MQMYLLDLLYISVSLKPPPPTNILFSFKKNFDPVTLTFDLWPWKSIGFQILLRTKYVPSLV